MHVRYVRTLALTIITLSLALGAANQEPSEGGSQNFSEADAQRLMAILDDGLTGHSPDKFLSAFDAGKMPDYAAFAGQVQTFFSLYSNFRVYYRILSVSESKCKQGVVGNAMVEFQLRGEDANNQVPGMSLNGELHLTVQTGKKGWLITEINREFFR